MPQDLPNPVAETSSDQVQHRRDARRTVPVPRLSRFPEGEPTLSGDARVVSVRLASRLPKSNGVLMAHRKEVPPSRQSQRQQDCESLIREVSARPGIRELMKVYGAWKQADRSLEPHRAISRNQVVTTTTNHTAFFHR